MMSNDSGCRFKRPFSVYEDSTSEPREPIISPLNSQQFFGPLPPPPPSTPRSDFLGPCSGPYAFGIPNQRYESRMLSSNPALGPFPIPPPGCKVCPKFFVYRPDGTPVPLIAIDELPPFMKVGWEDWQHPQWLRFMIPASLYPFPRTGTFDVYAVERMSYGQQPDNVDADAGVYDLPDRSDCQSPQPRTSGGVGLSMDAMALGDQEQPNSPRPQDGNDSISTVIRHEPGSCQTSNTAAPYEPSSPDKFEAGDDSSSVQSSQVDPFEPHSRVSTPATDASGNSFHAPQLIYPPLPAHLRWDSRSVQDWRSSVQPLEMVPRRQRSRSEGPF